MRAFLPHEKSVSVDDLESERSPQTAWRLRQLDLDRDMIQWSLIGPSKPWRTCVFLFSSNFPRVCKNQFSMIWWQSGIRSAKEESGCFDLGNLGIDLSDLLLGRVIRKGVEIPCGAKLK
jgi:hypothetical protein